MITHNCPGRQHAPVDAVHKVASHTPPRNVASNFRQSVRDSTAHWPENVAQHAPVGHGSGVHDCTSRRIVPLVHSGTVVTVHDESAPQQTTRAQSCTAHTAPIP